MKQTESNVVMFSQPDTAWLGCLLEYDCAASASTLDFETPALGLYSSTLFTSPGPPSRAHVLGTHSEIHTHDLL